MHTFLLKHCYCKYPLPLLWRSQIASITGRPKVSMLGFLWEHHSPARRRYFLDCLQVRQNILKSKKIQILVLIKHKTCFHPWKFIASLQISMSLQNLKHLLEGIFPSLPFYIFYIFWNFTLATVTFFKC